MSMLKVENLKKVFRTEEIETIALNGVTFEVKEGEFVAVMGPSGCGKSTLLNILGLLDNPTSGSYTLLDHEGAGVKEKDRTKFRKGNIGFVFQSFNLIDELTVYENVELPLVYLGMKTLQRKERVNKVLEKVNLLHRANHYPQQLSGGQQQRVAIARAYAVNPSVLLMDEPFGALDAQTRTQLQTELLKTWESERKTCFFITHDVDEAIILAQKVIVMSARPGRIKEIVDIDIPYPRDQETKMSPRFMELKNHIWSQVYQEYLEVRK